MIKGLRRMFEILRFIKPKIMNGIPIDNDNSWNLTVLDFKIISFSYKNKIF